MGQAQQLVPLDWTPLGLGNPLPDPWSQATNYEVSSVSVVGSIVFPRRRWLANISELCFFLRAIFKRAVQSAALHQQPSAARTTSPRYVFAGGGISHPGRCKPHSAEQLMWKASKLGHRARLWLCENARIRPKQTASVAERSYLQKRIMT